MNDDKVILVTPEQYNEIGVDATQIAKLFDGRVILSVEQDLELVRNDIKTRKPIKYGHKVKV